MTFDPASAQPDTAFDPASAQPDTAGPDTRTLLRSAVQVKPDDAAEVARLRAKYPQPNDVLLRNLQDVRLREAVDNADAQLQTSPRLAEHMRSNPWALKQAHDDIPVLTQVADFVGKLGRAGQAGVYTANRGVSGVLRAGAEMVAPMLDALEADPAHPGDWRTQMGGNPLRRIAEGFGMAAQSSEQDGKAVRPTGDNWLTSGIFSGMESLTQNLLTLPLAVANPAVGLGVMGGMTGGNAYEDARAKGLPMEKALMFAVPQAAIEIATEKLPLGKLLGDLKAGTSAWKTLVHQVKAEIPGEQVATLLQDLNEWAVLNPEKPFSSYLAERPSAAAQTLVATLVGAGGNVAVAKAVEAAATRVLGDGADMQRAGAYAQALDQTMKAAEASALRERNPEAFRALMADLSDNGTVYIDAEVLNQMPPDVLSQMQGVAEEMPAALATGDTVAVKLADAMTLLAGTPQAELFMQHARTRPDAPSAFEAEAAGKTAGEFLQQEAERVLTQAQDQEAARASSDAVKQTLVDQLNTAARHSPAVNEGMATWAAAFYTAMGARTGTTPEAFYQRFPLKVVAQSAGGVGLNQDAKISGLEFGDAKKSVGALREDSNGNLYYNHNPVKEKAPDSLGADPAHKAGGVPESDAFGQSVAQGGEDINLSLLEQPARGTFNPKTLELVLNPTAELSTFFHETGHFFLEVMSDLASQPGAPAQVVDDMGKILSWFGVSDVATWRAMSLDEQRPYHERWAESIEQYVLEGKAPSAELQGPMRRFAVWFKSVYRNLKEFLALHPDTAAGQVNEDIRRVMDRMLATDEQIAQANEAAGLAPDEDADSAAAERLRKRSMADLKWAVNARDKVIAKLRKQAREIEKDTRAQVQVEVDQTPEMRAKKALDALRVTPEHEAEVKVWKEQRDAAEQAERERLKAEVLAANPDAKGLAKGQLLAKSKRDISNKAEAYLIQWDKDHPKPAKKFTGDDADAATIADSFGFKSVDDMLQAIDAFGTRADAIDALTQRRLLEEHGDLVDEDAIRQAANEAVHNEARARSLASELRTQREMLNPREDTGQVNAKGSKITVNALVEAAKQFGASVVGRTPLADLRNRAWQHTAAERRAAKRWAEATAAGKTEEAVKAKQDQMLNNAAARAALEARVDAQKILAFFRRVAKGNGEDVVEKGRDPDVVNAARAVLAAYGVQTPTTKTADDYLELVAKHDPETYNVIKPAIEAAMRNAMPLAALSFDQLQALNDDIDAMWHLAKRMRQMEVDGDLIDIQEAADDLHARMEEIGIPDQVPGEAGAVTKAEGRVRFLQFARALLARVEQWTERMDGKWGGPFSRFVFRPVKQAADAYRTDRSAYRKKFQALVDNVAPALQPGLIEAPELGYTFGQGHNGIGMAELLHAILHTGNESNKRKLLLGRRWAAENADGTVDTSRWDAFVTRLIDEGRITKAHYDFAQGVWDLLEETKPLAQKAHRDVFGRYFAEVTADAFVTPFGTYKGGYVPAQADPLIVSDADLRAMAEMENESMAYSFPTTSKGFTKSRVEYNRPLKLDLRTIPQHLDKVLLFSHMEPAVRGVARLLRQKGVGQALTRIDPAAYGGMLLPWLNRSARQQVETPVLGDGRISRIASTLRSRAGAALMFANISNTVQQVTGLFVAAVVVNKDHLMSGVAQMIAHPKETRAQVVAASPYMAERMDNEVAALNGAMNDILLNPSLYERSQDWAMRHSYFLQSAFDNVLGPMVWVGAYNQALAEGQSDTDAVAFADGAVRKTQGSTMPEDVSRMETGPAFVRLFTQFAGYFNMLANTNGTALAQIASETGLRKGAGKALGVVFFGMLAPIWVAEAIAQAFKGGPPDDDGDGYLDDWLASVFGMGTIKGMLAQVPFVAQLGQVVVNRFNHNPADDRFSLSPAVSLLESAASVPHDVYKAITDEANAQRTVRDVAALVSVATGLPASALARPVGYIAGQADGKIDPTGPGDAVRGLVTGVASADSKQR